MEKRRSAFDPKTFLTTTGAGRQLISFTKGQTVYSQGDAADSLFVIQRGSVKVTIKSQAGKEATLDILSDADLVGKDSMSGCSPVWRLPAQSLTAVSSESRRES